MSSTQFVTGKTPDRYRIPEQVGDGGMLGVYSGRQVQLGRMVAIKVLLRFFAEEEGFAVRFQREARIVVALRHPNIIRVYAFDHKDDLDIYSMVMEFIDGPTLKNRLKEAPRTPEEAVRIGVAVADAPDCAHHWSMLHWDTGQANILFLDGHQPILTEFGIAKILPLSAITPGGATVGTLACVASEIGIGKPGTAMSDIHSLSVVLRQMTAECLPFKAGTAIGVVMQHIHNEPPSPSFCGRDMPVALEKVIFRGPREETKDRYKDAGEMAAALRADIGLPANGGVGEVPLTSPRPAKWDGFPAEASASVAESESVDRARVAADVAAAAQGDVDFAGEQAVLDSLVTGTPDNDAATAVAAAIEWRCCGLYPLEMWILSSENIIDWQGPVAVPDANTCLRHPRPTA